jgi:hypothetical protein
MHVSEAILKQSHEMSILFNQVHLPLADFIPTNIYKMYYKCVLANVIAKINLNRACNIRFYDSIITDMIH